MHEEGEESLQVPLEETPRAEAVESSWRLIRDFEGGMRRNIRSQNKTTQRVGQLGDGKENHDEKRTEEEVKQSRTW